MPADQGPSPYDVLAALVVSLRDELAWSWAALARVTGELERAELAAARERIAELRAAFFVGGRGRCLSQSADEPGRLDDRTGTG